MDLPFFAACERNKEPILQALQGLLPRHGLVLEIGAGTGQHAVHFAPCFPELHWLPCDRPDYLAGLKARLAIEGTGNILEPRVLDVRELPWPLDRADWVYSANTAHIMNWQAVCAMFRMVGRLLPAAGGFSLYGPFKYRGRHTAGSNRAFDARLRAEAPHMGIRDVLHLSVLADAAGMALSDDIAMPANNRLLVFSRNEQNGPE